MRLPKNNATKLEDQTLYCRTHNNTKQNVKKYISTKQAKEMLVLESNYPLHQLPVRSEAEESRMQKYPKLDHDTRLEIAEE